MLKTYADENRQIEELIAKMHDAWVEGDAEKAGTFFNEQSCVILRHHKIHASSRRELVEFFKPIRARMKGSSASHYAPFRMKIQMWSSNFALVEIPDMTRSLENMSEIEVSRCYCVVQNLGSKCVIMMVVLVEE